MRSILSAAVAALLVAGSAQAAPFTNGHFNNTASTFVDTNGGNNYDDLSGGSTALPGWTVGAGHDVGWGASGSYGIVAPAGSSYFLDFTGNTDNGTSGSIQQTFDTQIGGQYQVSWQVETASGSTVSVAAYINGSASPIGTVTAGSSWILGSANFIATTASTTLKFQGTASTNCCYIGLAGVGVTQVPAPGSLALVAPALLWVRDRQRH